VTTVQATTLIADLRHRRRELRRELARVRWWRRLLRARRELLVGRLAEATSGDSDLDTMWEALAADAPTTDEIAAHVWADETQPSASRLDALDAIDRRLGSYEARLSANLEVVTASMVDAMAAAR
jgi:hypothetical protein